jgi:hypothetical protein
VDAAWALIAHEKLAAEVPSLGMFHPGNPLAAQPLEKRIEIYSNLGKRIDHRHPEKAVELVDF